MTTIAFDGHTLAADRQSTWGGTATKTRKIFRATHADGRRMIYGCAGLTHECQAYTRWIDGKIERPEFTDLSILSIDQKGRIWHANQTMLWVRIMTKQWAIGSGCDYALGAMAAGKSAAEAVRIASKLDVGTGFGVDVLEIKP
jgi:ATP-dependent protease HslVU (ClpYQ) peptidase subunit